VGKSKPECPDNNFPFMYPYLQYLSLEDEILTECLKALLNSNKFAGTFLPPLEFVYNNSAELSLEAAGA
jgi:hypothetical protein